MNRKQNITTWVQPEALKRKEEQGGETAGTKKGRTAGGWTEYKMDNGRTYYYHAEKQATQWTMPVAKYAISVTCHHQRGRGVLEARREATR